ncbi:MAG: hypothetical protein LBQ30_08850 [Treponema sp.]|jgi:hypothetical protein|nr:hypothetical protein [Treponema sp.]
MEMFNEVVVSALKACTSQEVIEDTFGKYGIDDLALRSKYLTRSMGSPETFFSLGKPSAETEYQMTVQMFLAGTWKLNALYDKLGLQP